MNALSLFMHSSVEPLLQHHDMHFEVYPLLLLEIKESKIPVFLEVVQATIYYLDWTGGELSPLIYSIVFYVSNISTSV